MADLIIVESPTKVKSIKGYLGSGYEVMASKGHIRDLPKSKLGIDVDNDFEPSYENMKDKSDVIKTLKATAKKCDKVYLAADPDREGEAISWHIAHILGLDTKEPTRITFNEITKHGVQEGMAHPRTIDMNLVDSQQARRVLDRLVGYKISPFLWKKVQSTDVVLKENEQVLQLLLTAEGECIGAVTRDEWGALHMHYASEVVLATGGSGGLYLYSTNGANATGDGFALALKAGAILKDMEFIQFHPTGLYIDGKVRGLVSEAVRGEGARLVNENGERIMRGVHELEDLAPRHVVAQTIYQHMQQGQIIYLDISMIDHFRIVFRQ